MKKEIKKIQAKTPLTLYEQIDQPDKSILAPEQILHIMQKTPANHVYTRPAKGGGKWDYVTGIYVKKVLNYVFAWDWDFEIKERIEKENQLAVLGRLTVRTANGKSIFKEQWGRAEIKKTREGKLLDYGNDLKAATTDALKKCASEFGIASDIYGKNEFREIQTEVVTNDIRNFKEDNKIVDAETEKLNEEIEKGLESEKKEELSIPVTGSEVSESEETPKDTTQVNKRKAPAALVTLLRQYSKAKKIPYNEEQIEQFDYETARKVMATVK